jgi:hypothetical protein
VSVINLRLLQTKRTEDLSPELVWWNDCFSVNRQLLLTKDTWFIICFQYVETVVLTGCLNMMHLLAPLTDIQGCFGTAEPSGNTGVVSLWFFINPCHHPRLQLVIALRVVWPEVMPNVRCLAINPSHYSSNRRICQSCLEENFYAKPTQCLKPACAG